MVLSNKVPTTEVIEAITTYLSKQIVYKRTMHDYLVALDEFEVFCSNYHGDLCDGETTKGFLEKMERAYLSGKKAKHSLAIYRRVCRAAEEYLNDGTVSYKQVKSSRYRWLNNVNSEIMWSFERNWLKEKYSSIWTITRYLSDARQVLYYTEDHGILLSAMSKPMVSDFLSELAKRRLHPGNTIWGLKSFFQYLISKGLIDSKLLDALNLKSPCHTKIYWGFSESECQAIFNAVDRTTSIGKRDYAMMVLAKDTGLRSEDIRKLQLCDIDWKSCEINIVQSKTQTPLTLYLTNRAGNAVADYILNGRPESEAKEVFLKAKRPFTRIVNRPDIVQRYMKASGFEFSEHIRPGFHSFRRMFGTALLNVEVPLPLAGEMLGQSSLNSIKPYIAVDIEHLKQCAMPMSPFLQGGEVAL